MSQKNKIIIISIIILVIFSTGIFLYFRNFRTEKVTVENWSSPEGVPAPQKMDDYHIGKEALAKENYKICDQMEDKQNRDQCVQAIASKLNDTNICNYVNLDDLRLECLEGLKFLETQKSGNIEQCDKFKIIFIKDNCYRYFFAKQSNPKYCDKINYKKEDCLSMIILKEAVDKKNIKRCTDIPLEYEKKRCVKVIEDMPKDQDGDGLDDQAERSIGLDPFKKDTDGDGVSDFDEIKRNK